jgi:hypothetical protein
MLWQAPEAASRVAVFSVATPKDCNESNTSRLGLIVVSERGRLPFTPNDGITGDALTPAADSRPTGSLTVFNVIAVKAFIECRATGLWLRTAEVDCPSHRCARFTAKAVFADIAQSGLCWELLPHQAGPQRTH